LKGAHIDHDQRGTDHQPYLNKGQALSMMRDILDGYEKRTGMKPKRVVVHKTSVYQPEEEQGFRDGAKGIVPGCDLIWLRQTPFRLVRKGSEEPWRGTLCQVEDESYLFTSGYLPRWDEFPGAHIPVPLQIRISRTYRYRGALEGNPRALEDELEFEGSQSFPLPCCLPKR
jgi:hypothetical protein